MRSGESVWSIAHELLTDWRDWQTIERLNGVTNDRRMSPGTILKIPRSLINEYQSDIQILDVAGTVTAEVLMKDGSVKAHLPLSRNQSLGQGDLLRTAEQSTVLLGFDDGTRVLILENSILKVERATVVGNKRKVVDIKVFLEQGEAEVRANPSKVPGSNFLIDTPVAFATTRGTTYRVRAQGDQTAAEVTQGLIGVGNNLGSTGVRQGFGTLTKKDEPPMKPKKLLQAPGLPDLSATIRYLPGRLSWDRLDGAVHYRSQISPDKAFTSIIYDKVSSHPKMGLPATLQDQSYWLRVSAVSDEGLQGFASTAKINIDARPFPPVRQAPRPSDSIYAGPLDFAWSRPETAEKFEIQIASDEAFKALVMQQVVEGTEFSTEITEPGGYFWRVTSIAEDGEVGPLGHVGKFTVKPVPPKPEMKEPVSTEHEIFFSWQEEQDVKKYQFQFAKDKEFKQLVVDQETENAELAIDKPEAGTYYMRVRAFDADDYAGEWAAPQEVEQPVENWWPLIFTATISVLLML
ncbi:FecR domain-containing protein [Neptuniibacter sp.]|uniref:FecR domain-containing protein n=1 Tax=Neptuniibacter sp. TaxID=1962643 RepID=UPI00262DEF1C|nr:FecR domain-containing protein [Neptuniibacter sp.]MCP4598301.1 LysM peptidoglycan-binding domain-containing protein [Neptuniibacter sp.]